MIEEAHVSFETAKLLKEKGFSELTTKAYPYFEGKDYKYDISCPTLQRAVKWLREVHHWHIFVIPKREDVEYMPGEWEEKIVGYQYVIMDVGEVTRKNGHLTTTALSPESACEAGIKYCLEHLI